MNKEELSKFVNNHELPLKASMIALMKSQGIYRIIQNNDYRLEHREGWGFARICVKWDTSNKPYLVSSLTNKLIELFSDTDIQITIGSTEIKFTLPETNNIAIKQIQEREIAQTREIIHAYSLFGNKADELVRLIRTQCYKSHITNMVIKTSIFDIETVVEDTNIENSLLYTSCAKKEDFLLDVEFIQLSARSLGLNSFFIPKKMCNKTECWRLYIMPPASQQ